MRPHFNPQVHIAAQTIPFRLFLEEITDNLTSTHFVPNVRQLRFTRRHEQISQKLLCYLGHVLKNGPPEFE